ncbi:MAG: protein kinase [Polyangiaceae bacterium]
MGSSQPLLGRTLGGRFKLTAHIGEGAMASVFRGIDVAGPGGSVDVAVKVMHPHLAMDPSFTARFKREAKAASMVKHANSVAILDVGEEAGVHYLVMELCAGRDLRDTLKAERRLSEGRAARIVMAICEALSAAHAIGVVHRDLKPENVMVLHDPQTNTDRVKVLDFGIAKLVDNQPKIRASESTDSEPPPALTQFGVVMGTPQYMSPEQCRGQPLDGRSDVYTCGILLYQLVTGDVPFSSESPIEVAGKQAFEEPPPPRARNPQLDPEMESIILRTLSKAPDARPQSAEELRQILGHFVERFSQMEAARQNASQQQGQNLRGLGRTLPLNASAPSVDEFLRARGAAMGAENAAPRQSAPPANPFAGPNAHLFKPPPDLPAGQQLAPQPAPSPAPIPVAVPIGAAPESAAQPAAPPIVFQPAQPAPRRGWGVVGWLCVLLSAGAGVGVGFALYRFLPVTF